MQKKQPRNVLVLMYPLISKLILYFFCAYPKIAIMERKKYTFKYIGLFRLFAIRK